MSILGWFIAAVVGFIVWMELIKRSGMAKRRRKVINGFINKWEDYKTQATQEEGRTLDKELVMNWTQSFLGPDKPIIGEPKGIDARSIKKWITLQTDRYHTPVSLSFWQYLRMRKTGSV